jgi:hypothetical protein
MPWLQTFKERKEQGITEEVVTEANGKYTYFGNTDWYDVLYRDQSLAHDHNLIVSGGNEKADFYVSGRFYDYNGLFQFNSDTYQTLNLRAKGSLQVYKWLRITNNMEFSDMTYHNPITWAKVVQSGETLPMKAIPITVFNLTAV